jgi:hypothetical protein
VDRQYDTRDAEEHRAVATALETLPVDHAARRAYAEGADTIQLSHLVADRPDIVDELKEAYLAGYDRMLERSGSYFRP